MKDELVFKSNQYKFNIYNSDKTYIVWTQRFYTKSIEHIISADLLRQYCYISYTDFKKLNFGNTKPILSELLMRHQKEYAIEVEVSVPALNFEKFKIFRHTESNHTELLNCMKFSTDSLVLLRFSKYFYNCDSKLNGVIELTIDLNYKYKTPSKTQFFYPLQEYNEMINDWNYFNYLSQKWNEFFSLYNFIVAKNFISEINMK